MKSFSLLLKGELHMFSKPMVMGILNITPDSFFAGSRMSSVSQSVEVAGKMLEEGATILDIGGQSTRPGAERLSKEDEAARVIPHIEAIAKAFPRAILSIDTFYAKVAEEALQIGACIVNDVSGGNIDAALFATAAQYGAPYICMHMKGEPQTMQQDPHYQDVMAETMAYFSQKIHEMTHAGIHDILLDPGFGFGKNQDHNWTIMKHLDEYLMFGKPLVVGISRKKMIQRATGTSQENALNGTTAANMLALKKGAAILRVHDVKEAAETIAIYMACEDAL
jgi:dihydropteroate synthase